MRAKGATDKSTLWSNTVLLLTVTQVPQVTLPPLLVIIPSLPSLAFLKMLKRRVRMRSKAGIFKSSILRQEKALAPLCAVAPQLRTAEPTANPRKMGLCWHLGSCVLAGARYATWRLLFEKTPKSPVLSACLAGTNPGTSGAFCGANPNFDESEDLNDQN